MAILPLANVLGPSGLRQQLGVLILGITSELATAIPDQSGLLRINTIAQIQYPFDLAPHCRRMHSLNRSPAPATRLAFDRAARRNKD